MLKRKSASLESKEKFSRNPFLQFKKWFDHAKRIHCPDYNAMVLATVRKDATPDARVVYLKGYDDKGFVFFTHYNSPKGQQAEAIGKVALNFYWPSLFKQVRIRGRIKRISSRLSDQYFSSRPRESQINTLASKQSQVIKSRQALIKQVESLRTQFVDQPIPRPATWGGYIVEPFEFEFFQGVIHRLNQRIRYAKKGGRWCIEELSP